MIPTIHFTYMSLNQLPTMEGVFSSFIHSDIKELSKRYTLISHDDNKYYHDCPMYELLYSDLFQLHSDLKSQQWRILYEKLIKVYGEDVVNLLIVKDEEHIRKKIINILNFVFEELYKIETICIKITIFKETGWGESSIPKLIYSTIEKSFYIIEERKLIRDNYLIISKNERGN